MEDGVEWNDSTIAIPQNSFFNCCPNFEWEYLNSPNYVYHQSSAMVYATPPTFLDNFLDSDVLSDTGETSNSILILVLISISRIPSSLAVKTMVPGLYDLFEGKRRFNGHLSVVKML